MSDAFAAIKAGLEDAVEYAAGEKSRGRAHQVLVPDVDVRELREKLEMSQAEFAATFRVSVAAVRNWEQKRRTPDPLARLYLHMVGQEPRAVKRMLKRLPMDVAEETDKAG